MPCVVGSMAAAHLPGFCMQPLQGSWDALNLASPSACTPGTEGCPSAQGVCGAGSEKIAISASPCPSLPIKGSAAACCGERCWC